MASRYKYPPNQTVDTTLASNVDRPLVSFRTSSRWTHFKNYVNSRTRQSEFSMKAKQHECSFGLARKHSWLMTISMGSSV